MNHSINIAISFDTGERPRLNPACEVSSVNNVKVLVNTGSDSYSFNLSRVPVVGEKLRILDDIYVVRDVVHTPNSESAAEVSVSRPNRN